MLSDNKYFKECLNIFIEQFPDLFPAEIANGYSLNGIIPESKKQSIAVRRIKIKGMKTERTDIAWKILLLSMYRVPDFIHAMIFDKDEKHI